MAVVRPTNVNQPAHAPGAGHSCVRCSSAQELRLPDELVSEAARSQKAQHQLKMTSIQRHGTPTFAGAGFLGLGSKTALRSLTQTMIGSNRVCTTKIVQTNYGLTK
jgi:hypothetical protein